MPREFIVELIAVCFSGSVVGVAGSSGCGKSTLAWLLLRLYDPQAGQVTLDGTPISALDPTWLRSIIACVSQVSQLSLALVNCL